MAGTSLKARGEGQRQSSGRALFVSRPLRPSAFGVRWLATVFQYGQSRTNSQRVLKSKGKPSHSKGREYLTRVESLPLLGPNPVHAVLIENDIRAHQSCLFDLRLCCEHPIKRITMMHGKGSLDISIPYTP